MVTGLFCLVYGFKHKKFEGQNYLNRAEQHTLLRPVLMKNRSSFPVGEGLLSTHCCRSVTLRIALSDTVRTFLGDCKFGQNVQAGVANPDPLKIYFLIIRHKLVTESLSKSVRNSVNTFRFACGITTTCA